MTTRKKQQEKKYSIFQLQGGLGKNVVATAVAETIKKNHPDRELIVVAPHPEVFINLDYVDRVYKLGNTPYFYTDFIKDKDILLFANEPYYTTPHITQSKRLAESWAEMYNLKNPVTKPTIVFNAVQKQSMHTVWKREKPILLLQTNGGPMNPQQMYSWTRDMSPVVGYKIAEMFKDQYWIIQVCASENQVLPNVNEALFQPVSNMDLFTLVAASSKRILIDSCLQHAAAALELPSTVLWIGTSPKVFGHDIHDNHCADLTEVKLPDSFLFDYGFEGRHHECPSKEEFIDFDLDKIFSKKEQDVVYEEVTSNESEITEELEVT